ncbi:unnamed protein product [Vitrella brassicaformis CCMP3155]|uniref:Uncharacterized protein n=2 Tax=Vitrella brassicaformis TaxID=1169539 RepID=A0A0G4G6X9_VITBC|nr:unnamed protein product [Vitrella brassicaformis CCMP3155]|eukprot:CEM24469.1 unnamed protein product [Vitrella brassicaformis CCMP3155]
MSVSSANMCARLLGFDVTFDHEAGFETFVAKLRRHARRRDRLSLSKRLFNLLKGPSADKDGFTAEDLYEVLRNELNQPIERWEADDLFDYLHSLSPDLERAPSASSSSSQQPPIDVTVKFTEFFAFLQQEPLTVEKATGQVSSVPHV